MKRALTLLVSLVMLTFIFGVVTLVMNSNTHAKADRASQILAPQIVQSQNISPQQEQKQLTLTEQIQGLSSKWTNQYLKAGWLHVVTHQTLHSDSQNIAPDGSVASNEFVTDDWILLDNKGNEIQGIFLQRNMQGNVIQVSVLKDKAYHNLTYGDVIPAPENMAFTPDFGFSETASKLKDTLEKTTADIKGKKLTKFIAKEKYQTPTKFVEFDSLVSSLNTEAVYDESGAVTLYQTVFVMQDGSERVKDSIEVTTMETVMEPPVEISNYLIAK